AESAAGSQPNRPVPLPAQWQSAGPRIHGERRVPRLDAVYDRSRRYGARKSLTATHARRRQAWTISARSVSAEPLQRHEHRHGHQRRNSRRGWGDRLVVQLEDGADPPEPARFDVGERRHDNTELLLSSHDHDAMPARAKVRGPRLWSERLLRELAALS